MLFHFSPRVVVGVPSAPIVHAEGKWAYVFYSTEQILRIANCGLYENMSSFVSNYYSSKVIIPIWSQHCQKVFIWFVISLAFNIVKFINFDYSHDDLISIFYDKRCVEHVFCFQSFFFAPFVSSSCSSWSSFSFPFFSLSFSLFFYLFLCYISSFIIFKLRWFIIMLMLNLQA